jgi:hypothetical protein
MHFLPRKLMRKLMKKDPQRLGEPRVLEERVGWVKEAFNTLIGLPPPQL